MRGRGNPRGLAGLPRKLYRRSLALRRAREESRFRPRLRVDTGAPELLLSPHWDDAVLDCWALLSDRRELEVVNVFAGTPAPGRLTVWDAITGASDSAERTRERLAEDAVALARARRTPHNVALLDAQYRPPDGRVGLEELDGAVSAAVPAASRVYAPAAIGSHADHLLARTYARMLRRAGMPVTLYADLPYCVLHGWPEWVDGTPPDAHRNVDAFWLSCLKDVPEMPDLRAAEVVRLDPLKAAAKLDAMRCYATQFACLNYGGSLLIDPAIHAYEVRWQLT